MVSPSHRVLSIHRLPFAWAGLVLLLAGCSSPPPPRLYVLSSAASPSISKEVAALDRHGDTGSGSSLPSRAPNAAPHLLLGVAATVPNYLDRREIMVRSGPHEVKAMENERWAEDLSVNTARAIVDDLATLLPSFDVIMLPSRLGQAVDYELRADFTNFEIDADGNIAMTGRWSVLEGSRIRASGRILQYGRVAEPGVDATAAALSRQLRAVSTEIARTVASLPAHSQSKG